MDDAGNLNKRLNRRRGLRRSLAKPYGCFFELNITIFRLRIIFSLSDIDAHFS